MADRDQQVRERAYALWEQGGGEHGRHEEHWTQAEQEVDSAPTQVEPAEGGDGSGGDDAGAGSAPAQVAPAEGEDDGRLPGSPKG